MRIVDERGEFWMSRSKLVRRIIPTPIHFTYLEALQFVRDPRWERVMASYVAHRFEAMETDEVWYYDDMGILAGSRGYVVLRGDVRIGSHSIMRG